MVSAGLKSGGWHNADEGAKRRLAHVINFNLVFRTAPDQFTLRAATNIDLLLPWKSLFRGELPKSNLGTFVSVPLPGFHAVRVIRCERNETAR